MRLYYRPPRKLMTSFTATHSLTRYPRSVDTRAEATENLSALLINSTTTILPLLLETLGSWFAARKLTWAAYNQTANVSLTVHIGL